MFINILNFLKTLDFCRGFYYTDKGKKTVVITFYGQNDPTLYQYTTIMYKHKLKNKKRKNKNILCVNGESRREDGGKRKAVGMW